MAKNMGRMVVIIIIILFFIFMNTDSNLFSVAGIGGCPKGFEPVEPTCPQCTNLNCLPSSSNSVYDGRFG